MSVPKVLLTSVITVTPVHGRGHRTVSHYLFIQLNKLLLINTHLTLGSNYIFQISHCLKTSVDDKGNEESIGY